jgi:hypothetical protein
VTDADRIQQVWGSLPPERKRELLDFAEFLAQRYAGQKPRRSTRGLWSDWATGFSIEEIKQAREEMWRGFPREDI